MRIVVEIVDESGRLVASTCYVAPEDGTALDKHLENAAAEVKEAVLRAGVERLKSRP